MNNRKSETRTDMTGFDITTEVSDVKVYVLGILGSAKSPITLSLIIHG